MKKKGRAYSSKRSVYAKSVSKTKFLLTPNFGHRREILACWCVWEVLWGVLSFKKVSNTEILQVMQNKIIKGC